MEIHFVTGKGGVGKSSVAAAMAVSIAQRGRRVLLVELGEQSFFETFLGLDKVGYRPSPYRSLLDVALWDGGSCLREYALHLIKIQTLYRLFFENPVSKALMGVAPGLAELAILGKLTSGPPRKVGPPLEYDCLVVDAYSSGHFLALLRAPLGMAEIVQRGPMGEQSRAIFDVLRDKHICHYHVITLPEELPVQESVELCRDLRALIGVEPEVWVNKVVNFPSDLSETSQTPHEKDFVRRARRQQQSIEILQNEHKKSHLLPMFFEADESKLIAPLSREVGQWR